MGKPLCKKCKFEMEEESRKGELHNNLLVNFIKTDYRKMEDVFTASQFFCLRRVPFAAVDDTEYTNRMFDLIFFGGSYAAKGTIDFSRDPPRARS